MSDFKKKKPTKRKEEPLLQNLQILNRNVAKKRPGPMDLQDASTYISNPEVRRDFDLWEQYLEQAKNPKTKEQRIEAKDTRRRLYETFNKPEQRKTMGDDELKLIGKHKDQLNKYKIPKYVAPVYIEPIQRNTPEINIDDVIRDNSRFNPGITKDLIQLQSDIKKNVDYVMGKDADLERSSDSEKDQKEELEDTTNQGERFD